MTDALVAFDASAKTSQRLQISAIHPHCTYDTIAGTKVEGHGFLWIPELVFVPCNDTNNILCCLPILGTLTPIA